MIKLAGLAVVALGFALRLNALLVIVLAGLVTGLAAGLSTHFERSTLQPLGDWAT